MRHAVTMPAVRRALTINYAVKHFVAVAITFMGVVVYEIQTLVKVNFFFFLVPNNKWY